MLFATEWKLKHNQTSKVTSKSTYLISCNNLDNEGHSTVPQVAYGCKVFIAKVVKLV